MYLQRKIDHFLANWHANPHHLPLIVKGPRQVGKTASILHFAHKTYGSIVEINFVEEPAYRHIAADGYRVENIIKNITLIDPAKKFTPYDTLVFFDEVQEYPEIATASSSSPKTDASTSFVAARCWASTTEG